jgi:hypothetical protein
MWVPWALALTAVGAPGVTLTAFGLRTVKLRVVVPTRPASSRTRRVTVWCPELNDLLTHGELVESRSNRPSPLRSHSHSEIAPPEPVESLPERVIGMPAYALAGAVMTATGGVPTGMCGGGERRTGGPDEEAQADEPRRARDRHRATYVPGQRSPVRSPRAVRGGGRHEARA